MLETFSQFDLKIIFKDRQPDLLLVVSQIHDAREFYTIGQIEHETENIQALVRVNVHKLYKSSCHIIVRLHMIKFPTFSLATKCISST